MKKLINKTLGLFALFILFAPLLMMETFAQESNNQPHKIITNYDLYSGSDKVTSGLVQINYTDNARYTIHSELSMPILGKESHLSWVSDAHGKIVENTVFPEYYQKIHSTPENEYFDKINFNHQSKKAIVNSTVPDNEVVEKIITLDDHLYDPDSLDLQIMIDLNNGHLRDEYKTIDGDNEFNISRMVVMQTQNELLKIESGEYNAQKIIFKISQNEGKDELATAWYDRDNHFIPIQIYFDDPELTEKPIKLVVTSRKITRVKLK